MADFRLCSICLSHSQASLCHYTLQRISGPLEPTFARLRYCLGGDRPSQTTYHTMSFGKLETTQQTNGISLTNQSKFESILPSMLHKNYVGSL